MSVVPTKSHVPSDLKLRTETETKGSRNDTRSSGNMWGFGGDIVEETGREGEDRKLKTWILVTTQKNDVETISQFVDRTSSPAWS